MATNFATSIKDPANPAQFLPDGGLARILLGQGNTGFALAVDDVRQEAGQGILNRLDANNQLRLPIIAADQAREQRGQNLDFIGKEPIFNSLGTNRGRFAIESLGETGLPTGDLARFIGGANAQGVRDAQGQEAATFADIGQGLAAIDKSGGQLPIDTAISPRKVPEGLIDTGESTAQTFKTLDTSFVGFLNTKTNEKVLRPEMERQIKAGEATKEQFIALGAKGPADKTDKFSGLKTHDASGANTPEETKAVEQARADPSNKDAQIRVIIDGKGRRVLTITHPGQTPRAFAIPGDTTFTGTRPAPRTELKGADAQFGVGP